MYLDTLLIVRHQGFRKPVLVMFGAVVTAPIVFDNRCKALVGNVAVFVLSLASLSAGIVVFID